MNERDPDRAVSHTVRAQLALRDLILSGRLRSGERISELGAVETTGVSRTPVRMALVRLEEEGLLEAIPSGGFMVKAFTERDILDSIELRGVLEGLAARFAAERGVSARDLEPLKQSLAELDELVARDAVSVEAFSSYVTMNARFHALLTELSRSAPLIRQIDRASALPFASPSAFVMAQSALPEAHQILIIAQDHHRIVVDAIENREGARAEAVMREHARLAARNLRLALRNRTHLDLLPALALIRSPVRNSKAFSSEVGTGSRQENASEQRGHVMRFERKWTKCTVHAIRDVAPAIREFVLRPEPFSPNILRPAVTSMSAYRSTGGRRHAAIRWSATPALTATASPFGARPTAAAARAICGRCSRARGSRFQARPRCSRSTGRENPGA